MKMMDNFEIKCYKLQVSTSSAEFNVPIKLLHMFNLWPEGCQTKVAEFEYHRRGIVMRSTTSFICNVAQYIYGDK